jgi:hypothetical protein
MMGVKQHVEALRLRLRELDAVIMREKLRNDWDGERVKCLKRQRLRVRERIASLTADGAEERGHGSSVSDRH